MHPQLDNRIRARLRLRHLELLHVLGETLNIHQAAPRLNLSQPATSKLLQELEELYRARLFERQARGLRATAAGETAIRWARVLLNETGESLAETHQVAAGASGRVRIGALPVAIPSLFDRVLANVQATLPGLVVSLFEGSLDSLLPALQRKEVDLVLARLTAETLEPQFVAEALYSERVSFVANPRHRLAGKRRIQLADMLDVQWILPPELAPMRQELERAFRALDLPRPVAKIETSSLLLIERALSQTSMVAAMPESVARLYAARGEMKALAVDTVLEMPPVGLVTRAETMRAPLVDIFLDLVRTAARELQASPAARRTASRRTGPRSVRSAAS